MSKIKPSLIMSLLVIFTACVPSESQPVKVKLPPPSKKIVEKIQEVSSYYDSWKSEIVPITYYYLIAEDGTLVKVDLHEYARTKAGVKYTSDSCEREPNLTPESEKE
jgi:hypothetical protein